MLDDELDSFFSGIDDVGYNEVASSCLSRGYDLIISLNSFS